MHVILSCFGSEHSIVDKTIWMTSASRTGLAFLLLILVLTCHCLQESLRRLEQLQRSYQAHFHASCCNMLLPWECNCVIQAGARPKSAPYRAVAARTCSLSPVAHRTLSAERAEPDVEVLPGAATDEEITQVASSDLELEPTEMPTEVPTVAPTAVPPALQEVQDPPAPPQAQELPAQQLSAEPASRSTGSHEGDSVQQVFRDLLKACRSSEDVPIYSDQNPPSSDSSDEEGPPGTVKRMVKQAKKEAGLFLFFGAL